MYSERPWILETDYQQKSDKLRCMVVHATWCKLCPVSQQSGLALMLIFQASVGMFHWRLSVICRVLAGYVCGAAESWKQHWPGESSNCGRISANTSIGPASLLAIRWPSVAANCMPWVYVDSSLLTMHICLENTDMFRNLTAVAEISVN